MVPARQRKAINPFWSSENGLDILFVVSISAYVLEALAM